MKKIFVSIAILGMLVVAGCKRDEAKKPQADWSQDKVVNGQQMQPDHSFLYYWIMYHFFFSNPQPTYHVYMPSSASPAPAVRPTTVSTPSYFRSSGGFGSSSYRSSPSPSFRSSGGFSSGSSFRSSGSFRSGGGFSRGR